jgi:DNA-binding protein HU-beta
MSLTTTTTQLASQLAGQSEMPKTQAKATIETLFGLMVAEMKKGQKVKIAGFGIFQIKDRKAREGRNPATGEKIQIKASKKVAFRASKELKESV